jgi:hypothetical protein
MAFKLEPNEYIIIIARRHWFKPTLETVLTFFSLLIPIFFTSIIFSFFKDATVIGNAGILSIIIIISWLYVVWNISFIIWTNHFLDVLIITNLHVIDIEQVGLWHREISTLQIQKIQDVSSKTEGIVASILHYGDLEIQTAGSLANFIVKKIQKPDILRQKINQQINSLHS